MMRRYGLISWLDQLADAPVAQYRYIQVGIQTDTGLIEQ
jgi:hypothetical protein